MGSHLGLPRGVTDLVVPDLAWDSVGGPAGRYGSCTRRPADTILEFELALVSEYDVLEV